MGIIRLSRQTEQGKVVFVADGASLVDLGDEVAYLSFHSNNQMIGPGAIAAIERATEEVVRNWRGLVIGSDEPHFCAGMNLMLLLMEAENGEWEEIDLLLRESQQSIKALRMMPRPVVAAPHRKALSVGAEICLSADRIIFAADTYFGFEEMGIGLIPASGGCLAAVNNAQECVNGLGFVEYVDEWFGGAGLGFGECDGERAGRGNAEYDGERLGGRGSAEYDGERLGGRGNAEYDGARIGGAWDVGIMRVLTHSFESIALAQVSVNGDHAKRFGYRLTRDSVVVQEGARIAEAKRAILELDRLGYGVPVADRQVKVGGREGAAELKLAVSHLRRSGRISQHDALIAGKLAEVMTGGQVPRGMIVPEQYLLDLEREAFLSLIGQPLTQARMKHMLAKGERLYN